MYSFINIFAGRLISILNSLSLFLLLIVQQNFAQTTVTFSFTGNVQTFTVPPCVTSLTLDVAGSRGSPNASGVSGGFGGLAHGVLTVTPGDILYIYAGGMNGYNGGGLGGSSTCSTAIAGNGGGGSDIRLNGNSLAHRVIVAGGGGGAGGDRVAGCGRGNGGGGGGGYYGGGGGAAWPGVSGTLPTGGTQIGGGSGGISAYTSLNPTNHGQAGSLAIGGNGGLEIGSNQAGSGLGAIGGAGGGLNGMPGLYTGGGGGGPEGGNNWTGQSGAGGSSYLGTLSGAYTQIGTIAGNGYVVITYTGNNGVINALAMPPSICAGSSATLMASGQQSYTWSNVGTGSSVVVSPTTNSTYTVTGTNSLGCISSATLTVNVDGAAPVLTLTNMGTTICFGNTVVLGASGASSYSWSGGITNGVPFTPTATTNYTLNGSNGCGTSTAVVTMSVLSNPVLSITASSNTICAGASVTLLAAGASTYSWTGGVVNGLGFTPTVSSGYTVTGTDVNGCIASANTSISVSAFSGASVSVFPSNPSICLGGSLNLIASGMNTYTWSTGANSNSILVSPGNNSVFSVQGTNSAGCISIAQINVMVNNSTPSLSVIPGTSSVCLGSSTALTASGANTYTWSGGIQNGVLFSPTVSSVYTVSGSNACGTATAVANLSVLPLPSVSASASSASLCSGHTLVLSGGGALSYSWTGGVNNMQAFYPASSTTYTVAGSDASSCTGSATIAVQVVNTPSLNPVSSHSAVCPGSNATLTGTGANSYTWIPGNVISASISVSPAVSTTYTLAQSSNGCTGFGTVHLIVYPPPGVIAIVQPTAVCPGNAATVVLSGANVYTINPFATSIGNFSYVVYPNTTTIYTVSGFNGNCTAENSFTVSVHSSPNLSIASSAASVCLGESLILTAGGALTYTWTPGLSNAVTLNLTPAVSTIYTLTGMTVFGCSAQTTVNVQVNPVPILNVTASQSLVCSGSGSTLQATGALNYTWSTGAQGANAIVYPIVTSIYSVTGENQYSCKSNHTVQVQVLNSVTAINGPSAVCIGSSISLVASPAGTYTWLALGQTIGNQSVVVVSPSQSTSYFLSVSNSSNNVHCLSSASVHVLVNALPIVSAAASKTIICKGYESATLIAGGAMTYSWINTGTGGTINVAPAINTTYTVQGTDANGCVNTATILIRISNCIGIEESQASKAGLLVYPNPSQGEFTISSFTELSLNLVNELGQVLLELSLTNENNFSFKVSGLSQGIYFLQGRGVQSGLKKKFIIQN